MANSCRGCNAAWTGNQACHCSNCHHTFSGITLFDIHRSQDGERGSCKSPEEFSTNQAGIQVMFLRSGMWRGPEIQSGSLRLSVSIKSLPGI